ncbi:hypothetical protein [Terrabacter sp. NPDC080008]|uniref:hypothetical protein n=1 Tax=Terrabacter sp. NPDC080008 TaxID=3155176 RepID=UPI00344B3B85
MSELLTLRPRRVFVAWVLAIYALTRVVSTTVLLVVMQHQVPSGMTGGDDVPVSYFPFTALWDGQWYQIIADQGYPSPLPRSEGGSVEQNAWAFYPLFPLLARVGMALTGISFPAVGSTIAVLCGAGAAVLMGLLLRERIGDPAAYLVVALWALFPASVTLQLAYTESLAMLLLVAYLYALAKERWLVATAVALLLGLSRPIAVPLGIVTLVVVVLRWRRRRDRPISTSTYAAMAAALIGCGVAGLLWPAIAWWRTGVRSAYTDTMATWRGSGGLEPFQPWREGLSAFVFGDTWGPVMVYALPLVLVAMVAGPWARNLGADLRTWSLAYPVYFTAGINTFTSVYRYLVPLFPLLVVLLGAGWADRRGNGWKRLLWRFVPLAVLCVVGQYYWTDILWRFIPPSDYPP